MASLAAKVLAEAALQNGFYFIACELCGNSTKALKPNFEELERAVKHFVGFNAWSTDTDDDGNIRMVPTKIIFPENY